MELLWCWAQAAPPRSVEETVATKVERESRSKPGSAHLLLPAVASSLRSFIK